MKVDVDWEEEAKRIFKAELARAGLTYRGLANKLEALGVPDNEAAIASRVSRGKFSFVFFLQCMKALGVSSADVKVRPRR
jgi:hypothetical protein